MTWASVGIPEPVMGVERRDLRVEHGMWERDPDVVPVIRLSSVDGSPLLTYAYRRQVFTFWRDENGNRWGLWDWERRV
jgi:hypothetical protein